MGKFKADFCLPSNHNNFIQFEDCLAIHLLLFLAAKKLNGGSNTSSCSEPAETTVAYAAAAG
jgi:hypothetical protein